MSASRVKRGASREAQPTALAPAMDGAPKSSHRLIGFEPDNFLAFLAVLGLLHALEDQQPAWGARVSWSDLPVRPALQLREAVTQEDLAQAVTDGCLHLALNYDFSELGEDWEFPRLTAEAAQRELRRCIAQGPPARGRSDLLSALFADGVASEAQTVFPTPLCVLFGQGHQFFLDRLSRAARMAGLRTTRETPEPLAAIRNALFRRWERADIGPSLRWDTGWFDRQWVDRASNPAKDRIRIETGAYALAALGLPVLTVSPRTVGQRIRLQTLGVETQGNELWLVWPIWAKALSLAQLRTLLAHPALYRDSPHSIALSRVGVIEVRRSHREELGRYDVFDRGVPR